MTCYLIKDIPKFLTLPRVNREAWNYSFLIKLNRNHKYIKNFK